MVRTIRPTRMPPRSGFTLIEMVVVIGIILLLVSLSAAGIMRILNLQQRRNTESAILKLDKGFNQQWKTVIDTAKTEQINPIAQLLAGTDGLAPNRARVIHILLCLKREFPTTFAEAVNPVPISAADLATLGLQPFAPNQDYVRTLQGAQAGHTESSACLYLALKERRRGTDFDPDTALSSQEVVLPIPGDGLKEIWDGWGRPINFQRWPYNPVAPYAAPFWQSPVGTIQTFAAANPPDTEDPEGLLANAGWQLWLTTPALWVGFTPQQQQAMQRLIANVFWWQGQAPQGSPRPYPLAPAQGGTLFQYQLTPVIWSFGSDGQSPTADDIYNFQLSPLGGLTH
jgi:prepilin-type N-terminal cleavage/methylation domain-containing protein